MNKRTTALTTEQYREIIATMKEGGAGFRPNERIATALVLEGNLGLRISDIVRLRLSYIVNDGGRYRLAITEQKTGKQRVFTVPLVIYQYIENFCLRNGIGRNDLMFPLTTRAPLSVIIWAMRVSVPIAFGNGTPQRYTRRTAMTLPLSSGYYSTAARRSHNGISALSHKGLRRP